MKIEIGKLHAEDIQVDFLLREGRPERVIVETAGELGIDLILICTDERHNSNRQRSTMP
jgi:nucleotide-binding universal stress UspA family protein